jgi:hypothetical protein
MRREILCYQDGDEVHQRAETEAMFESECRWRLLPLESLFNFNREALYA